MITVVVACLLIQALLLVFVRFQYLSFSRFFILFLFMRCMAILKKKEQPPKIEVLLCIPVVVCIEEVVGSWL